MLNLKDIHPLTSFLRDHKTHIENLVKTGRPEVLTVNGKAAVVVQDIESYQKLCELADLAETAIGLKKQLEDIERGTSKGIPADEAVAELRRMVLSRKKRSA
jgi:hypothetical protein